MWVFLLIPILLKNHVKILWNCCSCEHFLRWHVCLDLLLFSLPPSPFPLPLMTKNSQSFELPDRLDKSNVWAPVRGINFLLKLTIAPGCLFLRSHRNLWIYRAAVNVKIKMKRLETTETQFITSCYQGDLWTNQCSLGSFFIYFLVGFVLKSSVSSLPTRLWYRVLWYGVTRQSQAQIRPGGLTWPSITLSRS